MSWPVQALQFRLKGFEFLVEGDAAVELLLPVHLGRDLCDSPQEGLIFTAAPNKGRERLVSSGGKWQQGTE